MREDFLVFGAPLISEEEVEEVAASLRSGWLGTGPKVARFEADFAAYKGVPAAVALHSCTAALHLSLLAANLIPGDEVITTPLTFAASVNAIIHAGATPVLADVDPATQNIDPEAVNAAVTERTRAILPVHFAGRPCEMDELTAIAREHGLVTIEDCAHAIETEYKGQKAGTIGEFGCFSFYVTKNLVTGEGGMVLAKKREDLDRIKILGLHGMSRDAWKRFSDEGYKHYYLVEIGFKYNMMDIQAAIGLHQLAKVESWYPRREAVWNRYQEAFADLPLILPLPPAPETRHAYHLYTIRLTADAPVTRDEFLSAMNAAKIGTGVHYLAIPEHPVYQERFGWHPDMTPHARDVGRSTVSLPLSAKLTDKDVDDVIETVRGILTP